MSGNRNLSYAQLSEAYSWFKSQEGEDFVRLEDEGADLTEVMIRLGNGAYRAPLPRLVDRGPLTPEEIAIQAEEDEESDSLYDPFGDDYVSFTDDAEPASHVRSTVQPTDVDETTEEDVGPTAISGWHWSHNDPAVDPRPDNGTGGYACWKDTTKSPTQFMRHAGRIQPTFRRSQARAA